MKQTPTFPPGRYLALDVAMAGETGWAFFERTSITLNTWVYSYGSLHFNHEHLTALLLLAEKARMVGKCNYAVIEGGYVAMTEGKQGKKCLNARTSMVLAESRGAAKVICRQAGLTVVDDVPPTVWQSAMLTRPGQRIPNGKTKEWSMRAASLMLGIEVKDEHAADALNLLWYVESMARLDEMVKR